MRSLERSAKPVLRIALSLVFLYFGFQQITSPSDWTGFVPNYVLTFGISAMTVVFITSLLELIFGLMLIIELFTRFSPAILALHLFGIAFYLGFNDLGVRDFGLAAATLVVFLNGADELCLDKKFRKEKNI